MCVSAFVCVDARACVCVLTHVACAPSPSVFVHVCECLCVCVTTKTGQQWETKQCQAATLCSLITKWILYS